MAHNKIIAVLTGDLVASQTAGSAKVEAVMQRIAQTAQDLGAKGFTRFRGDGWQIALQHPQQVLWAVLLILADLRASGIGVDTRISVGIGSYTSLGTANLSDATGPAFVLSGQGLDAMPKQSRLAIAGGADWQKAMLDLVDWHTAQWTAAQAEAVAMFLRHAENHQQLAARLGITRQAMQSRLAAAGINALDRAIAAFQAVRWSDTHD
jgi:hypothetical protein